MLVPVSRISRLSGVRSIATFWPGLMFSALRSGAAMVTVPLLVTVVVYFMYYILYRVIRCVNFFRTSLQNKTPRLSGELLAFARAKLVAVAAKVAAGGRFVWGGFAPVYFGGTKVLCLPGFSNAT